METRTVFKSGVSGAIYTNTGRLIKGDTVRDKFLVMADSVLFWEDADIAGGFLFIDGTSGHVDVSFIKATSPSGLFLKDNGTWASLPSQFPDQAGNDGKFLKTSSGSVAWADIPSPFPGLDGNDGKFLKVNGSSVSWGTVPTELPSTGSANGKFLSVSGTDPVWATITQIPDTAGNNGKFLSVVSSVATWVDAPGGSPAGSTHQIQFRNSSGAFAASSRFQWQDGDNYFIAYGRSLFGIDPSSGSPTALVDIGAGTSAAASLRIRSGSAPSSPNDGDIWYTGSNIFIRQGGANKRFQITV